jgi:hypothetical protein
MEGWMRLVQLVVKCNSTTRLLELKWRTFTNGDFSGITLLGATNKLVSSAMRDEIMLPVPAKLGAEAASRVT